MKQDALHIFPGLSPISANALEFYWLNLNKHFRADQDQRAAFVLPPQDWTSQFFHVHA